MKLQGVTLRDLAYLVAVAEHGHFGRAAEACHVSQPSLSVGVKKVEDALGYVVFERTNRRVLLTRRGGVAVQRARAVLEAADAMLDAPDTGADPLAGPFALGAIATIGPYLLPRILRPLRQAHPALELEIEEGVTERLLDRLLDGVLDAVILSPPIPEAGVRIGRIYREPFRLAVPAESRLSRMDRIPVAALDPGEAVLLEEGHCLRDQALEICGGAPGRRRHAAMSLETLKGMVAAGTGFSLIPATAIGHPDPYDGLLEYRPFSEARVGRDVALAWRRSRIDERDVTALLAFLRAHVPDAAAAAE